MGTQRIMGNRLGEEAGEMKRRRIAPRVKLNRTAVCDLLDQLDMSQNELAQLSGLSSGHFSQLMSGARCPSAQTRLGLQQVLGVSDFDSLFTMERDDN